MDTETVKEKIERWKGLAEIFLKNQTRVAVTDTLDNYYFGDLLFSNDEKVRVKCFAPSSKIGNTYDIYWYNVLKFEEYLEESV